jgi:fibronectin type 3 domain-containing protein
VEIRPGCLLASRVVLALSVIVTGLTASLAPSAYGQSINLAWDASSDSNVTGYNVYRSEQSGVFSSTPLNGTTVLTTAAFNDSTVQSGTTYYYVVTAVSTTGVESGDSNQVQATLPVTVINQAPVVSASPAQTITLPATATLIAIATDDGLPNGILTYSWSVVSGTGVTLSSPTASSTQASFSGAGTYMLRVTVSDGQLSASADAIVTVLSAPPANGQSIKLAWDASSDSNVIGYNLYRSQQSGVFSSTPLNGTTVLPTAAFNDSSVQSGSTYYYVVTAVSTPGVESGYSNQVQATVPVTVTNTAPLVSAGPAQTITLPATATLTAIATDDGLPNGVLTYSWTVVSGTGVTLSSPTASNTKASFSGAGTYTLRVTVSDGQLSASADIIVTVRSAPPANKPPVVSVGPAQTITLPATATLTATATDDGLPNGVLTYSWSVVSGTGVTLSSPTASSTGASFSGAGTYTLRVTVSDGQLSASADVIVTVRSAPPANKPPVVSVGPAQTITLPATATLTATATDDGLPNGVLTYNWSVVSGTGVTLSSPTAPSTQASFSGAGTYTLRVTVSDGQLSASADGIVTVLSAPSLNLWVSKSGTLLGGTTTSINLSSSDPQVTRLELDIDQNKVAVANASTLIFRWNLRHVSGTHVVSGLAYNSNNVVVATTSVTVTVVPHTD